MSKTSLLGAQSSAHISTNDHAWIIRFANALKERELEILSKPTSKKNDTKIEQYST